MESAEGTKIKTPELLEEERKARAEKALKVSEATLEVEQVLLKHNLTWEDWGSIIETMNARTQIVFGNTTIRSINESYGGRT